MRSNSEQTKQETTSMRELDILNQIEDDPEISQRDLSTRAGIALGLTNIVLKNLVQKGYIRMTRTTWKRWIYSLTPDGFTHKIHLTVSYIRRVLHDYQGIRETLMQELEPLALNAESTVALCGSGQFAELVYLGLQEIGIEELDIFESNGRVGEKFIRIPIQDLSTLQPSHYDRILVASLEEVEQTSAKLEKMGVSSDKLVVFFADGKRKANK
jgi:predicted transcriptional regulator